MTESSLPGNVGTGTVTGTFVTAQKGTGGTPVSVAVAGSVKFTPTPSSLLDASADPPLTILPVPVPVTLDSTGSFSVELVATDDADLNPTGWNYRVDFAFTGVKLSGFNINVPQGTTVDLATVAPVASAGGTLITRGAGVPTGGTTGQALLKSSGTDFATHWGTVDGALPGVGDDGQVLTVVDGEWVPADASGGGGSGAWDDITGKPAVIAAGADAAAARTAIGAGTSSLALGTSSTTALAGDTAILQPGDLADIATSGSADDLADGTTNKAYTAAEKTKLAGIASGATANSTDAHLLDRANHTGTQATSTVTGLDTALAAKAASADLALVATSGQAGDLSGLLGVASLCAAGVVACIYNGTSWPARPDSRADVTCIYISADSGAAAPVDFVTGVDIMLQATA